MPKHHTRGPRHSSTHPRPHAHASIHDTATQPSRPKHHTTPTTPTTPTTTTTATTTPNKRKRINPLHVYTVHDSDHTIVGHGGRDRRYDWDSQQRYEYELPDQFVDEEVDEDEAFDDAEEDRYGEVVNAIMARQQGGRAGKAQRGGRRRGGVRREEEEKQRENGAEQRGGGEEGGDGADDGGVNEDDAMDEGMTTLSAMLDEPDDEDAEAEDERPAKQKAKPTASQQEKLQKAKPSSDLQRLMRLVKQQIEAKEDGDEDVDEDDDDGMQVEEDGEEEREEEDEAEIEENEEEADENEEHEEEGDEDGQEPAESDEHDTARPSRRPRSTTEEDEDEEDENDDEDDDEDSSSKRAHLLSMIEQLPEQTEAEDKPWKRKDRSGAQTDEAVVEESEFAAIRMPVGDNAAATVAPSSKLTLADLMQSLQSTSAPAAATTTSTPAESKRSIAQLKKKLSVLSSSNKNASASSATATLAEPLADVRQEEITRRLGYGAVKQELERWAPIIERHRDATNLHFPLHVTSVAKPTSETMAAAYRPVVRSELERDLERIMREYGVRERRVGAGAGGGVGVVEGVEEAGLQGRELTEEEMERRRGELSKMKSLLFHHELKQRRINKIKSKTYRRLRKQQHNKAQLTADELALLDPDEADRRRLKAEVERVKERMTLAHTNRSAWMRRQMRVNANVQSGEVKQAMEHSQSIAQRLKRKIDSVDGDGQGGDSGESQSESEGDEDMEDDEADAGDVGGKQVQASKAPQLRAALRSLQEEGSEEEKEVEHVGFDQPPAAARSTNQAKAAAGAGNKSGLLGLKFMQRAIDEKRQQTREAKEQLEDELKEELKREMSDSDEDKQDAAEDRTETKRAAQQQRHDMNGKRKLGGGQANLALRRDELMGAEREEKSVLLPHSFQSANVGMGRGKRARVGTAIDVDADGEAVKGHDELFEVEAFEDDGQPSSIPAKMIKPLSNKASTSKPSTTPENGKPAKPQQANNSTKASSRYHLQASSNPQPSTSNDDGDTINPASDDNPWAQPTDVAGRKALRDDDLKKRRRKRHKPTATANSDGSSGLVAAVEAGGLELDVNSVVLSAGGVGAVDEEQQRLVAAAFAVGEDEEKQFADVKAAAINATVPTIEQFTTTLPGWGNWTGEGLQPRPPTARQQREQRDAQRKLLTAQQLALNSRRDTALPHVLVSEASDRRASRYLLARLPFPYTSVEAYEQSLLQPLGKEWNAVEAHQKAVRPAVTLTKGAIIEAVTYHESDKERREAERRDEDKRQKERQRDGQTSVDKRGGKETKAKGKAGKGRSGGERRALAAGKQSASCPTKQATTSSLPALLSG